MSRLFKRIHYVDEARKLFLDHVQAIDDRTETVKLDQALGRVLARDVYSNVNVPPFNRAAMDGFAVIAEDTFGASEDNPIELIIVGESSIGNPFKGELNHGEAVRIHTGARVPNGADAVIQVEYTEEISNRVLVFSQVAPNDNVGKAGEDIKKGDLVLKKGVRLQPYDLAILKSAGYKEVTVVKKPRVGIFACGDELVNDMDEISEESGKILETNRIMLISYLRKIGCDVVDYGIVSDDIREIKEAISSAKNETDLLLTIGGTSVGKKDLLPIALSDLGKPGILVRGITASPGRPLILSIIDGFPVISLPGYPVAALIDFIEFVIPAVEKMMGVRGVSVPNRVRVRLRRRVPSKPGVRHYVRVRLIKADGELYAEPLRITGSGVLSSVVKADGLLVIPEDVEGYEAGDLVDIILFRDRIGVWDEEDI